MTNESTKRPVERYNNPSDKSMTFEHQLVAERYFQQDVQGNAHFSPGSVLICSIGTNWKDGCKDKVLAMLKFTREAGYICRYMEIQVYHNIFPQASHASSRNSAVLESCIGGTEFVLCLDTDIEPEEDILVKLLERNVAIIGPYVIDPEHDTLLGSPFRDIDSGVYIQRWLPQCFLLMKTAIFNCPEIRFGSDEAEDLWSLRCSLYGHQQIMDTSVVLTLASPPGRPDAMKFDNRMEKLKEVYDAEPKRNWMTQEDYDMIVKGDHIVAKMGSPEDIAEDHKKLLTAQKISIYDNPLEGEISEDIKEGVHE